MKTFFNWLLGQKVIPEPQPTKELHLSAERNVLQSIKRKTGASYEEIRKVFWSEKVIWRYYRKPGCKGRYYDVKERAAIIDYCVKKLGKCQ